MLCGVNCEDLLRLFAIARISLRRNAKLDGYFACFDFLCGVSCEDFSLRRNDKYHGYFLCDLSEILCGIAYEDFSSLEMTRLSKKNPVHLSGTGFQQLIFSFFLLLNRSSNFFWQRNLIFK
jgi:hypothetical protein